MFPIESGISSVIPEIEIVWKFIIDVNNLVNSFFV